MFRERGAKVSLSGLPSGGFETGERDGVLITAGDITEAATRERLIARTIDRFSRIDVLINNAGVGLYASPSTVPLDLARRMFDVNLFAAVALAQAVLPDMRRRKAGAIVNVGSVGGYSSLPWAVMYCATKFALHAYSDSLRRELRGSGVCVTKICPGIVDTSFRDHVLAGTVPGGVRNIRRMVSPRQVAMTVVNAVERGKSTAFVPRLGRLFTLMECLTPGLMDLYLSRKW